jgi:hypothetical protein
VLTHIFEVSLAGSTELVDLDVDEKIFDGPDFDAYFSGDLVAKFQSPHRSLGGTGGNGAITSVAGVRVCSLCCISTYSS